MATNSQEQSREITQNSVMQGQKLDVVTHDDYVDRQPATSHGGETNLADIRSKKVLSESSKGNKITSSHNFIYGVKI